MLCSVSDWAVGYFFFQKLIFLKHEFLKQKQQKKYLFLCSKTNRFFETFFWNQSNQTYFHYIFFKKTENQGKKTMPNCPNTSYARIIHNSTHQLNDLDWPNMELTCTNHKSSYAMYIHTWVIIWFLRKLFVHLIGNFWVCVSGDQELVSEKSKDGPN